jgi:hypothetical protein
MPAKKLNPTTQARVDAHKEKMRSNKAPKVTAEKTKGFDPTNCPNCGQDHTQGTAKVTPACLKAISAARKGAALPEPEVHMNDKTVDLAFKRQKDRETTPVLPSDKPDFKADAPGEAKGMTLDQVVVLAKRMQDYERELEELNTARQAVQDRLELLQSTTLPDLMASLSVSEFKMENGDR